MQRHSRIGGDPKRGRRQKKKEKKVAPLPNTYNGKIIHGLLVENRLKGSYKDYVVFTGDEIMEWNETFPVQVSGERKSFADVIHKRDLWSVIGPVLARRYWIPGAGRVSTSTRKS